MLFSTQKYTVLLSTSARDTKEMSTNYHDTLNFYLILRLSFSMLIMCLSICPLQELLLFRAIIKMIASRAHL